MKRSLPRDTRDCLVCLNPAELCAHHAGAPAVKLRAKNAALKAEVRRLKRLEPHARHSPSCAWFRESGTFTCDCGFAAALAPRRKKATLR